MMDQHVLAIMSKFRRFLKSMGAWSKNGTHKDELPVHLHEHTCWKHIPFMCVLPLLQVPPSQTKAHAAAFYFVDWCNSIHHNPGPNVRTWNQGLCETRSSVSMIRRIRQDDIDRDSDNPKDESNIDQPETSPKTPSTFGSSYYKELTEKVEGQRVRWFVTWMPVWQTSDETWISTRSDMDKSGETSPKRLRASANSFMCPGMCDSCGYTWTRRMNRK